MKVYSTSLCLILSTRCLMLSTYCTPPPSPGNPVLAAFVLRVVAVVDSRCLRGFTTPAGEALHSPRPDKGSGRLGLRRPETHRALCLGSCYYAVHTKGVVVALVLRAREKWHRKRTL